MLAIRKVVFYALVLIVTVSFARIFYLLINAGFFRDVDEISRLWKTDPIVSIYIPSGNQSRRCMREYETVHINSTLSAEASDLPHIFSKTWRGSPICVKRGGKSALSYKESYPFLYDRELPDKRGRCNDKLKKCGDGFDHNDGAICFPREDECPITNMLILPANQEPSAHAFWESAGTFQHSNHTLFVRRQVINELPINDIAFQLTQFDAHGENVRGVCYKGDNQIIFRAVTSSNNTLNGSYDATFPPACEVSDQRYVLVDQVPVQDHFLHNLDLTESAFATNKLNKSYASAVRAAFLDKENNITLGMYFSREVPWKDGCAASRTEILRGFLSAERSCFVFVFVTLFWLWGNGYWVFFGWEEFRYMDDIVGFFGVLVLVILGLMFMKSVTALYRAVDSAECTDVYTRDTLQSFLEPAHSIVSTIYIVVSILVLLIAESFVQFVIISQHSEVKSRIITKPDGTTYEEYYLQPRIPSPTPTVPLVQQPVLPATETNVHTNGNNQVNVAASSVSQHASVVTATGIHNRTIRRSGH